MYVASYEYDSLLLSSNGIHEKWSIACIDIPFPVSMAGLTRGPLYRSTHILCGFRKVLPNAVFKMYIFAYRVLLILMKRRLTCTKIGPKLTV